MQMLGEIFLVQQMTSSVLATDDTVTTGRNTQNVMCIKIYCFYKWSDSKVMRLIFSWLYWQYCGPLKRTAFDLDPSSIATCSGMAVQCFSVE